MIEYFETTGLAAWDALWLPVLIWSVPALLVALVARSPRLSASQQVDLIVATLLALPVAVLMANLPWRPTSMESLVMLVPLPAEPVLRSPGVAATAEPNLTWLLLGLLTWIAALAASIGAIRFGASVTWVARIAGRSRPVTDANALSILGAARVRSGVGREVHLREWPGCASPLSCGVLRPVICVPDATDPALELILLHELEHHRSGDLWKTLAVGVVRSVFMLHPLAVWLARRFDQSVEEACDAAVVNRVGVPMRSYAVVLLQYATSRAEAVPGTARTSGTAHAPSTAPVLYLATKLKKRIEAMNQPSRALTSRPVGLLIGMLVLVLVSGLSACSDSAVDAALDTASPNESPREMFKIVEEMPELIGGMQALHDRIQYPALAKKAGIEGRVVMQVTVDKEGTPTDIKLLRGIGAGADEEALRVMQTARFTPGKQRGIAVPVQFAFTMYFTLDGKLPPPPPPQPATSALESSARETITVALSTEGLRVDGRPVQSGELLSVVEQRRSTSDPLLLLDIAPDTPMGSVFDAHSILTNTRMRFIMRMQS
ncbi:MAG: M56 family metallopeptidase [Rhodothermales bacterium]